MFHHGGRSLSVYKSSNGYSGSSHYFNRIIQKIFEDIPDTHIKIDDLLTESKSMEEAIATFRKILVCCKEKHIKLARHKLEFGREVDFAGTHIGGPEGFRPTTAKIEGIINILILPISQN